MNAEPFARAAYGRSGAPLRTPRQVEYDLFARVTRKLREATTNPRLHHSDLVGAVHDNLRLWRALASDLAQPGNGLPGDLRAGLRALGAFTAQHSRKVLKGGAEVGILIDINTAVMRGLRGEGEPS